MGLHVGDDADAVRRNRALLRARLPAEPAWLTQVHGTDVLDAASVTNAPPGDASVSRVAGTVCAILTADCLPVLMCNREGTVVAAAHAGWRGLANGVLENTVQHMRQIASGEVMAWLGPAIGARRFEVGQDVVTTFAAHDAGTASAFSARACVPGKYLADITVLARIALKRAGVTQVYGGERCTVEERQDFYSYRRDGVTGRMASLIWLK